MSGGGFNPDEFGAAPAGGSTTEKKRKRDQRLRERGLPVARSKDELLDEIDRLLSAGGGKSAEEIFRQGLETPGADPLAFFKKASEAANAQAERAAKLPDLLDEYLGKRSGRTFRPEVLQQPSESRLFQSVSQAATGPAPDLLFRDVFAENFGDLTKMSGPYDKFVAGQAKELEQRFLTDTFRQFNEPGFVDQLRKDYEGLFRQKEAGDFSGAGGSIPAFEDFIKQRVRGNYRSFLEQEKPKLQQAFQLTAPNERGQREIGRSIAPLNRIL